MYIFGAFIVFSSVRTFDLIYSTRTCIKTLHHNSLSGSPPKYKLKSRQWFEDKGIWWGIWYKYRVTRGRESTWNWRDQIACLTKFNTAQPIHGGTHWRNFWSSIEVVFYTLYIFKFSLLYYYGKLQKNLTTVELDLNGLCSIWIGLDWGWIELGLDTNGYNVLGCTVIIVTLSLKASQIVASRALVDETFILLGTKKVKKCLN